MSKQKLTQKQEEALKSLVEKHNMDQDQQTRYILESFVDMGLAFKNTGTREVKTSGAIRRSTKRLVRYVFYTATPSAFRMVEELEEERTAEPKKVKDDKVTNNRRTLRSLPEGRMATR